jgi:molybdopterin converting factor subunit 1
MKITIKLFAAARQVTGRETVDVELTDSPAVAELRRRLAERFPELASLLSQSRFAVNGEYVSDRAGILSTDEVALIPPVSGG